MSTDSPASIKTGKTIGFLGAGQLARMSGLQAFRYGFNVAVASNRTGQEPVEQITPLSYKGSFEDARSLKTFAEACDLITLENEFINSEVLSELIGLSGTPIYPTPESFALIENKYIEKKTFEDAGIAVTPYQLVHGEKEMQEFGDRHGWPYMLKSSKGGYDGYGNVTVHTIEEGNQAFQKLGGDSHDILAEAFVDFRMEVAVQVARNHNSMVVYPCVETVQENHICTSVKAPAQIDPELQEKAQKMAMAATEAIDGTGLFAFEFFLTNDNQLLLNESAPRPHNSGHYTIEGCITSQFENHVRAVAGLPLGSASPRKPAAVMVNLLGTHNRQALVEHSEGVLDHPDGHLHIYGKTQSKTGRKMGHATFLGDHMDPLFKEALKHTDHIKI